MDSKSWSLVIGRMVILSREIQSEKWRGLREQSLVVAMLRLKWMMRHPRANVRQRDQDVGLDEGR